ncbi:hypothetical protein VC36_29920 [Pseudomonas marginalis]|nr:hypothetical protein VC37_29180 [Pseudomonas marginalis]KJZ50441.1 hypothetical protein VC36_29920 [Pseudomonas marginalis]
MPTLPTRFNAWLNSTPTRFPMHWISCNCLAPYLRIAYALDEDSLRQACAAIHRFCAATR